VAYRQEEVCAACTQNSEISYRQESAATPPPPTHTHTF
jgi:hypothetical protein